ncbi:hypothetical protein Tco_1408532, partial [Tanacetum coccineum]
VDDGVLVRLGLEELWNGPVSITTDTQGQIKVLPPRTAEDIIARERERKARTTLLMALPEDHLAKFHKMTNAKEMWDAIKSRFGGNDESKKMQKYILKQQFEGFSVSNSEGLHKGYDRGQEAMILNEKEKGLQKDWQKATGILLESVESREIKIIGGGMHGTLEIRMGHTGKQEDLKHGGPIDGEAQNQTHSDASIEIKAYSQGLKKVEAQLVAHQQGGMHAVPPPMTGNYMPSGPDIEVDYSQFTYGPKQTQPSESESQSSEFDTCESNISTEPSELVSEPVVNESNVECQPKVWSDAPIIEEYESDSEDEYVSIPTKQQETPSFANQQVKTPRETVKNQFTHSQKPKVDKKELGYGFTVRACFVCGSLNHLIRDCDFHEKRMARKAELNNGWNRKSSEREIRQTWNNVQRVNKQNQFVPSAVLTRTGKIPVNTARASGTKNVSTARQSFNRQAVLTSTAMKVNTVKPIVNRVRPANVFHKTHSPSSRPFKKTTVLSTNFSKQKVNTAKVVIGDHKDTIGTMSPNTMVDPVLEIDYPHRALKNKGIVDSGNSEKEVESTQDYFVLPIWSSYSSTIKRSTVNDAGEAPNKHPDLKTNEKTVDKEDQVFLNELERLKRQEHDANDAVEALKKKILISAMQKADIVATSSTTEAKFQRILLLVLLSIYNPLTISPLVKKGKPFFRESPSPLFSTMLVQPTEDEGEQSERPSEPQLTPSLDAVSEIRSGGNHGGQSSSDKSLSENKGDMTLQSVSKVRTDKQKVSTDKEKDSTDRPDEGTIDQNKGRSATPTTPTPTPTIFGDDETMLKKNGLQITSSTKLQEEARDNQFTVEERTKFLHDTIAAQRRFLAEQRAIAIRNRPPIRTQLRNQMMTYLKHSKGTKNREKVVIKKMLARKRKRPQSDVDSDDELRKCLKIATFKGAFNYLMRFKDNDGILKEKENIKVISGVDQQDWKIDPLE